MGCHGSRTRGLRRALGAAPLVAVLVLAPVPTALAAPPSSETREPLSAPSPPSPSVVRVVVVGDAGDAAALEPVLVELLGRLGLTVVVSSAAALGTAAALPSEPDSLALAHVDLSVAGRASVTVTPTGEHATPIRREVAPTGSKDVLLEETAHVVHATIDGLLAKTQRPPSAAQPPPPPPKPTVPAARPAPRAKPPREPLVPPAEPPAWGMDAAALVGLHGAGPSAGPVFGAGLAAVVGYRRGYLRPTGWLLAEYRPPFDVDDSDAPSRAHTAALRLLPSIDLLRASVAALHLCVGGGVDIFAVEHTPVRGEGRGDPGTATRASPVLTGMLGLRLGIAENVQLLALAGVDVDLAPPTFPRHWQAAADRQPWRVRPGLLLGVSFTLAGAQPLQ